MVINLLWMRLCQSLCQQHKVTGKKKKIHALPLNGRRINFYISKPFWFISIHIKEKSCLCIHTKWPQSKPPCVLTTVLDVHVVQLHLGGSAPTVQLLRVKAGLASLLPQLDPADVAAAVEHHAVQAPATGTHAQTHARTQNVFQKNKAIEPVCICSGRMG